MSGSDRLGVSGDVRVPGDKSISHRALLLAACATGESRIRGVLTGADCRSTAEVLRALGTPVPALAEEVVVRGQGLESWTQPTGLLDCGNSGTTARLLLGLLAGRPLAARLTGDASLRSRPMRRVTEPLSRMGATIRELVEPDRLPLEIRGGTLLPLNHRSSIASAQVKSAILLAGLSGSVPVTVWEPYRSRDHTERMLGGMGIRVATEEADGGWQIRSEPARALIPPIDVEVPGDPSSAAFLVALALLASEGELRIRGVALNPTRTGFLDAARRMGGAIRIESLREEAGEPVGDLVVSPSTLRGISIGPAEIPSLIDEVPILMMLAARAEGETRVEGAEDLRAKESDRIGALVSNLRRIGVAVEELPDGMVVQGSDAPLAGPIDARHDHRIAMSFAVLAMRPEASLQISDMNSADVSFPGFQAILERAAGRRRTRSPEGRPGGAS